MESVRLGYLTNPISKKLAAMASSFIFMWLGFENLNHKKDIKMKKMTRVLEVDLSIGESINKLRNGAEWILTSDCLPTIKLDGTACMIKGGKLYRRYNAKMKPRLLHLAKDGYVYNPSDFKRMPENPILCNEFPNPNSGSFPVWILCKESEPNDKLHIEAFNNLKDKVDGTYELIGEKINGNKLNLNGMFLVRHKSTPDELERITGKAMHLSEIPNPENAELTDFLIWVRDNLFEGLVFHNKKTGDMLKLRRNDLTRAATDSEVEEFIKGGGRVRPNKNGARSISDIRDWHLLNDSDFNEKLFKN